MARVDGTSKRVWELVDDIKFAMLVTHDGNGDHLRARPMAAHPSADENMIYFLTDVEAGKDHEVEGNSNVCVAFAVSKGQKYVSITGTADVTNDRQKIKECWNFAAKAWWDSENDPSIRLLRVTPAYAEYWDSPGTTISYAKMAIAAVTGSKPDMGENKKVDMK
jgi:general stress protein 26